MVKPKVPLPTAVGAVTVAVYTPALHAPAPTAGEPCVPPFSVKATVLAQVAIELPDASLSCAVNVLVAVPLAMIEVGLATMVEALVLGGPAV